MAQRHMKLSRAALAGAAAAALATVGGNRPARADLTITSVNAGRESVTNGTYAIVDFYLTGLTGADTANQGNNGTGMAGLLDLSGTFSAPGSGTLAVAGDGDTASAGYYGKFVTNAALPPSGYDTSFVNFSGVANDLGRSGTGTSTVTGTGRSTAVTAIGGTSTSFVGTFANGLSGTTIRPGADTTSEGSNLIARILVTPGYSVSFSGVYGSYGSNGAPLTLGYAAPIVTLTAGTAAPYSNFTRLTTTANAMFNPATPTADSINVNGGAVGTAHVTATTGSNTGLATAYVQASGFGSNTDQLYALKLSVAGTALAPTDARVQTIVTDINASSAVDGVTASAVVGSTAATTFAGYDILLKAHGTFAANDVLSWNFDNETNVAGLLVTDVAAAPEPTSLALLGVGLTGLLSRRRRR